MKPASIHRLVRHSSLSARAFAAAIAALLASHSAHAAIQTWDNGAANATWDASSLNWSGAAWTNGNDAVFGATGAGAITVDGTRSVGDLTLSSAGYSFSGGNLSVAKLSAANAWIINNNTTISSGVTANFGAGAIAGTLNKLGAGTLTLSGAVSSTGFGTTGSGNWGITVSAGSLVLSGTSTFSNAGLLAVGGDATISGGTHDFTGATSRRGIAMSGGRTVTVSGGTVNTVKILAGNGTSGIYTQTGGTVIMPTTGVVELGTGGNASQTSVFNLDGGILVALQIAPATGWLGTSTINLNGGTFRAVGLTNTNLFSATVTGSQPGNIFVKAGGAMIDPNGRNVTISSAMQAHATSTGGGLTKMGGATTTLTLSGANTYTGTTTITAGGLTIGIASTRSGTTILTGATGTGDVTLANAVTLGESSSLWYVPTLTLQGNVTLAGNNRQQVGFKTLDLAGGTRTLFVNPTGGNIMQTISGNTALEGTGRSRWETLNDIGALTVQNGNLVLGTNLTGTIYAGFMFQHASLFAGNAGLTVGANVHLQTGAAGALGSTTANTAKLTVNGIWNLSASTAGADQSVHSLAGSGKIYTSMVAGNANARTITLNGTAGSTDFSGELSDGPGSGALSISKTGASTQILSGTSSYTGPTSVNDGTLLVSGSITGSAASVASAATLGGAGGTVGSVAVADGGIVAPGAGVGTLNTGAFSLLSGSFLKFELGTPGVIGGLDNDLLSITGALTLDGTLQITQLAGFGQGTYRLANFSGGLTDSGLALETAFTNAYPGSFIDATGTPNQVNLVVIPEPGAAISLLGGVGLLLGLRRRRA